MSLEKNSPDSAIVHTDVILCSFQKTTEEQSAACVYGACWVWIISENRFQVCKLCTSVFLLSG